MRSSKVLFVCLGNICRSPMAEYVFRHLAKEAGAASRIISASAGTSGWHNGENMHQGTQTILKQHHISPIGFSSSQVKNSDFQYFDYLIAMDNNNLAELERLFGHHPEKIFKLTDLIPEQGYDHVPDPWYTQNFEETYMLVEAGSRALLRKLGISNP